MNGTGIIHFLGGTVITIILLGIAASIGIAGWKANHHKAVIGFAIGLVVIVMVTFAGDIQARNSFGAWAVTTVFGK